MPRKEFIHVLATGRPLHDCLVVTCFLRQCERSVMARAKFCCALDVVASLSLVPSKSVGLSSGRNYDRGSGRSIENVKTHPSFTVRELQAAFGSSFVRSCVQQPRSSPCSGSQLRWGTG